MPSESAEDRKFYGDQFASLHERLDEIKEELAQWRVDCARNHAHDREVLALINGNGKPSLAVRLDRLEQAEPRAEKASTRWLAVGSLAVSFLLVLVEAVAAFFKK